LKASVEYLKDAARAFSMLQAMAVNYFLREKIKNSILSVLIWN